MYWRLAFFPAPLVATALLFFGPADPPVPRDEHGKATAAVCPKADASNPATKATRVAPPYTIYQFFFFELAAFERAASGSSTPATYHQRILFLDDKDFAVFRTAALQVVGRLEENRRRRAFLALTPPRQRTQATQKDLASLSEDSRVAVEQAINGLRLQLGDTLFSEIDKRVNSYITRGLTVKSVKDIAIKKQ